MESGDGDYYTWEQQLVLKSDGVDTYEKRRGKIAEHIKYYGKYDSPTNHALQEIAQELHRKVIEATEAANKKAKNLLK